MENQLINQQPNEITEEEAVQINQSIRMEIGNLTMKVIHLSAKVKALEAENAQLKQGKLEQKHGS